MPSHIRMIICKLLPLKFILFCRWLLGYPVVYLFSKDHVADAVYNLSTKYLHIYKILVRRFITFWFYFKYKCHFINVLKNLLLIFSEKKHLAENLPRKN